HPGGGRREGEDTPGAVTTTADVVVVGAGIAGVSAAYHLAVGQGISSVVLVDPRPPLSLTSDKSTECYRNWWPDRAMVGLMNRSIDIYEQLAGETEFGFNHNGYLFVTGEREKVTEMQRQARAIHPMGASADVLDRTALLDTYPFIAEEAAGALFVPRAGWFRAQDLGLWMLDRARDAGATMIKASVDALVPGRVTLDDGSVISTGSTVIAAGPMSSEVAELAGLDLPLFSELHLKVAFRDHLGIIPRDAPMTIWSDTQTIDWSEDEKAGLLDLGRDDLIGEMPIFCHFRPEGGAESPYIVALWEYHDLVIEPTWPLPDDPLYPEVVLRGLTTMVPGLAAYHDRLPESFVDGGYYTKTPENRPLIGPSGLDRVHLLTGMSGFGVMVSAGAADLLAAHIAGKPLPDYADAFLLSRYDDPDYSANLANIESGQL
ncbi:MAG TPA: FAD-binding oxidoreductase, partial [Acidimicrobiia bacterium]